MDFYDVVEEYPYLGSDLAYTPYARKIDGEWEGGEITMRFLNMHFGEFDNATDMIAKAESYNLEHIVLYFEWLVDQGKLTM